MPFNQLSDFIFFGEASEASLDPTNVLLVGLDGKGNLNGLRRQRAMPGAQKENWTTNGRIRVTYKDGTSRGDEFVRKIHEERGSKRCNSHQSSILIQPPEVLVSHLTNTHQSVRPPVVISG
ncbi:hypothetical protein FOZ63_004062, partial [Perkinsus olseni]